MGQGREDLESLWQAVVVGLARWAQMMDLNPQRMGQAMSALLETSSRSAHAYST